MVRTGAVHTLEVVWLLSADSIGLRTQPPANLTERERGVRRLGCGGGMGGATEEGGKESHTNGSFYRCEVIGRS